jgi:RsiW-degrading membrane proteinase PrsW (M82 family)
VLGSFGWGALAATLAAGLFNSITGEIAAASIGPEAASAFVATFVAPVVEESFKGVALLGLLLIYRDEFDSALDGLVYGALVGVGFAMTENVLYFGLVYLEEGPGAFGVLVVVRTITGELGHAMWTGTMGAAIGWGRSRHGRGRARVIVPVLGWLAAIAQHAAWNGSLSFLHSVLVALGFFVAGFVSVAVIWRLALRRERRILAEHLADEVGRGTLTPAEYAMLANDKQRRQALRQAKRTGGRALRRVQRRFNHAAAELAFRKYHLAHGEEPRRAQQRANEQVYRDALAVLRAELVAGGTTPKSAPHP